MSAEQRKEVRVNTDRTITVTLSSGQRIHARLVNLSIGGLAIRYPAPGEIGAQLGLMFQLPGADDLTTITVQGIVRHSHVYHEDFITGVEFSGLAEESLNIISRFIETRRENKGGSGLRVSHRNR